MLIRGTSSPGVTDAPWRKGSGAAPSRRAGRRIGVLLPFLAIACAPDPGPGPRDEEVARAGGDVRVAPRDRAGGRSAPPAAQVRTVPPAGETDTGAGAVFFVDVAGESGIDYENVSGSAEQGYILETISAGAAFLDVEGDGDQDLYLVNGTRLEDPPEAAGHRFYRHRGPGSTPLFEEATEEFGLAHTGWGMGCAVGDADNDGDPDLYVTYWGANRLYLNEGGEGFTEAGRPAAWPTAAGAPAPPSGIWTATGCWTCTWPTTWSSISPIPPAAGSGAATRA